MIYTILEDDQFTHYHMFLLPRSSMMCSFSYTWPLDTKQSKIIGDAVEEEKMVRFSDNAPVLVALE